MSSRDDAIAAVLADGTPGRYRHVPEILDAAAEAGHIHFDDDLSGMAIQADAMRELLVDVAQSGVAFEDSRIKYVEVQIDKATWDRLQDLVLSTSSREEKSE